jgi:hypothetical protein
MENIKKYNGLVRGGALFAVPGPARLAKGFSEPWKKNWSFNWPALEPSWKYS